MAKGKGRDYSWPWWVPQEQDTRPRPLPTAQGLAVVCLKSPSEAGAAADKVTVPYSLVVQASSEFPKASWDAGDQKKAGPALLEGVRLFLLQRKKPTPKGTGRSARSAVTSLSSGLAGSQQLEELSRAGPGLSSQLSFVVLPGSWQPDSLPIRPCSWRLGWVNYW